MATIRQRVAEDGSISYQAQVRLRGHPPQSASFTRKTDAKQWAQQTESAIRDGRHFPMREAKRHTLEAAIDRYLKALEIDRPHAHKKQKQLLEWWKGRVGDYALARLTPAVISS